MVILNVGSSGPMEPEAPSNVATSFELEPPDDRVYILAKSSVNGRVWFNVGSSGPMEPEAPSNVATSFELEPPDDRVYILAKSSVNGRVWFRPAAGTYFVSFPSSCRWTTLTI